MAYDITSTKAKNFRVLITILCFCCILIAHALTLTYTFHLFRENKQLSEDKHRLELKLAQLSPDFVADINLAEENSADEPKNEVKMSAIVDDKKNSQTSEQPSNENDASSASSVFQQSAPEPVIVQNQHSPASDLESKIKIAKMEPLPPALVGGEESESKMVSAGKRNGIPVVSLPTIPSDNKESQNSVVKKVAGNKKDNVPQDKPKLPANSYHAKIAKDTPSATVVNSKNEKLLTDNHKLPLQDAPISSSKPTIPNQKKDMTKQASSKPLPTQQSDKATSSSGNMIASIPPSIATPSQSISRTSASVPMNTSTTSSSKKMQIVEAYISSDDDMLVCSITAPGPITGKGTLSKNPNRYVLHLDGTWNVKLPLLANHEMVKRIRTTVLKDNTTNVIFELAQRPGNINVENTRSNVITVRLQ